MPELGNPVVYYIMTWRLFHHRLIKEYSGSHQHTIRLIQPKMRPESKMVSYERTSLMHSEARHLIYVPICKYVSSYLQSLCCTFALQQAMGGYCNLFTTKWLTYHGPCNRKSQRTGRQRTSQLWLLKHA